MTRFTTSLELRPETRIVRSRCVAYRLFGAALLIVAGTHCSRESSSPRTIRAHSSAFKGIAHAEPSWAAPRYCKECHGEALAGGAKGEPSCYQCHGKNWLDVSAAVSRAPSDHTADSRGFLHHPDRGAPNASCSECHGASLEGTGQQGRPGCELCHGRLWETKG